VPVTGCRGASRDGECTDGGGCPEGARCAGEPAAVASGPGPSPHRTRTAGWACTATPGCARGDAALPRAVDCEPLACSATWCASAACRAWPTTTARRARRASAAPARPRARAARRRRTAEPAAPRPRRCATGVGALRRVPGRRRLRRDEVCSGAPAAPARSAEATRLAATAHLLERRSCGRGQRGHGVRRRQVCATGRACRLPHRRAVPHGRSLRRRDLPCGLRGGRTVRGGALPHWRPRHARLVVALLRARTAPRACAGDAERRCTGERQPRPHRRLPRRARVRPPRRAGASVRRATRLRGPPLPTGATSTCVQCLDDGHCGTARSARRAPAAATSAACTADEQCAGSGSICVAVSTTAARWSSAPAARACGSGFPPPALGLRLPGVAERAASASPRTRSRSGRSRGLRDLWRASLLDGPPGHLRARGQSTTGVR